MRTRIGQLKVLKVGGLYYPQDRNDYRVDLMIKSITETVGSKMPTKAYYDNGETIQNSDQLARVVLQNGMIHYLKKGTYRIVS